MFARLWQILRPWWPRGLGEAGALIVVVDLTLVLPPEIGARADLVVVPAHWHRRGELIGALARQGHAVVCVVDAPVCDEVRAAVDRARRAGQRVAIRRVARREHETTV